METNEKLGQQGVPTSRYLLAPWTLSIAGVVVVCYVAQVLSGIRSGNVTHFQHLLMYSLYGYERHQFWRIFTPNLTNGPLAPFAAARPLGVSHMVLNVVVLLVAGPAVERRLGPLRFVTIFVVSGAVAFGSLVLWLPPADFFDGTSGAVFGILGALAVLTFIDRPRGRQDRVSLVLLGLLTLWGLTGVSYVSKEIHFGGFMAGIALTLLFVRFKQPIVVVGSAAVVIAALCVLVVVRTPAIKRMDRRLHPYPASALGRHRMIEATRADLVFARIR